MTEKIKIILGLISGIIGIFFLHIILAPLAIYLGYRARKNDFKKLGTISIILGILGILIMLLIPTLKVAFDNDYPVVLMVSGSMEHKIVDNRICDSYVSEIQNKNLNLNEWWEYCGNIYSSSFNIEKSDFEAYPISNGFNVGDILIIKNINSNDLNVGDVILFYPQNEVWKETNGPIPHRIVKKWEENGKMYFSTKGDHNFNSFENFEDKIPQEDVVGKVIFKIPKLGYLKIILNKI